MNSSKSLSLDDEGDLTEEDLMALYDDSIDEEADRAFDIDEGEHGYEDGGESEEAYESDIVDEPINVLFMTKGNSGVGLRAASGEAYAVFDSATGKLTFFRGTAGQYSNGQVVGTKTYYTGIETMNAQSNGQIPWADKRESITSVDFADTIAPKSTRYWFYGCTQLTSITGLSEGHLDTSNTTAMTCMFYHCSQLTSLDLSSFNTSNVTTMAYMFEGCTSLSSLNVSSFNTSKVVNMREMFYNCSELLNLDVSHFDTSKVETMSYMFYGCKKLTSLDVSHFDTSKVSAMDRMFCDCWELTNLDVSNFNTTNVTNMRSMFNGCKKLSTIDVSHFNTANVTDMSRMFYGCAALSSLNVAGFTTTNATDMSYMFYDCSSLSTLDVSHFNTSSATDMACMFYNCPSLTSLDVSHFDTSNVTSMRYMFYKCSGLSSLDVSHFNTSNVTNMKGMFEACSGVVTLDVSGFDTAKTTDTSYMFANCKSLTSLDVSRFDTSKVTSMAYMFYNCSLVPVLNVSRFDTSNVENMVYMFGNCSSVSELNVSGFDTAKVTDMSYMFYGCSSVAALDVSHFDTSKVTNMRCMFYNCRNVPALDVSHFDTGQVTNMRYMFYNCKNVPSLDVSHFNTSNVTDMSYMFQNCALLSNLNLLSFNTSNVTDMSYMFYNCPSLSSLDLSSFNTPNVTNMSGMFFACTNLQSLDISNFNTANVTSMAHMFRACQNLSSLDVSHFNTAKVTSMEKMFYMCFDLASLDVSNFNTYNVENMRSMFQYCTSLTELDVFGFDTQKVTDMRNMFCDTDIRELDLDTFTFIGEGQIASAMLPLSLERLTVNETIDCVDGFGVFCGVWNFAYGHYPDIPANQMSYTVTHNGPAEYVKVSDTPVEAPAVATRAVLQSDVGSKLTSGLTNVDKISLTQWNYRADNTSGTSMLKSARWTDKESGDGLLEIRYAVEDVRQTRAAYFMASCCAHGFSHDVARAQIYELMQSYDVVDVYGTLMPSIASHFGTSTYPARYLIDLAYDRTETMGHIRLSATDPDYDDKIDGFLGSFDDDNPHALSAANAHTTAALLYGYMATYFETNEPDAVYVAYDGSRSFSFDAVTSVRPDDTYPILDLYGAASNDPSVVSQLTYDDLNLPDGLVEKLSELEKSGRYFVLMSDEPYCVNVPDETEEFREEPRKLGAYASLPLCAPTYFLEHNDEWREFCDQITPESEEYVAYADMLVDGREVYYYGLPLSYYDIVYPTIATTIADVIDSRFDIVAEGAQIYVEGKAEVANLTISDHDVSGTVYSATTGDVVRMVIPIKLRDTWAGFHDESDFFDETNVGLALGIHGDETLSVASPKLYVRPVEMPMTGGTGLAWMSIGVAVVIGLLTFVIWNRTTSRRKQRR